MDAAPLLDLSHASADIFTIVPQNMSLYDRFTCALVCKAWAEAATAATRSIILSPSRVKDLSCLQRWLEKHGEQLKELQLHLRLHGEVLIASPYQELLWALMLRARNTINIDSGLWGNIAAATKLTSVSFSGVFTESQQADVVAALTALPDLEQLTWCYVCCSGEQRLSDSSLLKQLTRLTALQLADVTAEAFEHLGSLTKLQDLVVTAVDSWAAAGFSGLQELQSLTSLFLRSNKGTMADLSDSICQLAGLQELTVLRVPVTSMTDVQALTALTKLCIHNPTRSSHTAALQLPGLRHLELDLNLSDTMPMSLLCECTQLRVLKLWGPTLLDPGSLVASTMLQHLELHSCIVTSSWQQAFLEGPGQLPHLTTLRLSLHRSELEQNDIGCLVAGFSGLQVLRLGPLPASITYALTHLSDLTSLHLYTANDQDCSLLAQLTGLRELKLSSSEQLSTAGLRQLAALKQLTSLGFVGGFETKNVSPVLQEQTTDRFLTGYARGIISKAPAGQPPDVSARLLRICDMADDDS